MMKVFIHVQGGTKADQQLLSTLARVDNVSRRLDMPQLALLILRVLTGLQGEQQLHLAHHVRHGANQHCLQSRALSAPARLEGTSPSTSTVNTANAPRDLPFRTDHLCHLLFCRHRRTETSPCSDLDVIAKDAQHGAKGTRRDIRS